MRVPLSWLAEYVDLPEDRTRLAEDLSHQGVKVEAIHRIGEGVGGVVAGEILEVSDHPNSDRLVLAEVDVGNKTQHVVVGVRNFKVGDKVPVAVPGSRLPGIDEISTRKIRGQESQGMLCSPSELQISEDHSGILILDPSAEVGVDIVEHLGLPEIVFELDITPNRPDLMGMLGVAREVAVLTGGGWRRPEPSRRGDGPAATKVDIEDAHRCPRYLAITLQGISMGSSPPDVQRKLSAAGVRPISNAVDATNLALWITGQPLHAFDLDKLAEGRIVVRLASAGEKIVTIDDEERELSPDDLVIADAKDPVALAGIMGGADSEVSDSTSSILLESAYFEPRGILRSSQRHGLRTEASARFERGVDPEAVAYAAELAASYLSEWSGAKGSEALDSYPIPHERPTVRVTTEQVNGLLGTSLDDEQMVGPLKQLGFDAKQEGGTIEAVVPPWRPDVAIAEDLIEEVARVAGYDNIPATLPAKAGRTARLPDDERWGREVRSALNGAGLGEAYTSSFISEATHSAMSYPDGHPYAEPIRIANPITEEEALLRPSLVPGLLKAVAGNVARRRLDVSLFELGTTFLPSKGVLPEEIERLAIVMHGSAGGSWYEERRELDFFDLKGVIEALIETLGIEADWEADWEAAEEPGFHPVRAAKLSIDGDPIGIAGEIAPAIARHHDIDGRVMVAELDREPLARPRKSPGAEAPLRYPAVLLDLAVVVSEEVRASDVIAEARARGGELLEDVSLFDVYVGPQVGEDRKSLALSLSFRAPDRTLQEKEALQALQAVTAALADKFGGEVRS